MALLAHIQTFLPFPTLTLCSIGQLSHVTFLYPPRPLWHGQQSKVILWLEFNVIALNGVNDARRTTTGHEPSVLPETRP